MLCETMSATQQNTAAIDGGLPDSVNQQNICQDQQQLAFVRSSSHVRTIELCTALGVIAAEGRTLVMTTGSLQGG